MDNLEKKQTIERSIERDRFNFIEAINSFVIEEIETEFDEDSVRDFSEQLKNGKLFILGETHGVLENPNIVYTLIKKFGLRNLGLEWSGMLRNTIQEFLENGELDFESINKSCDGRITAGHFALLKKLHSENLIDKSICFDEITWSGSWDLRDSLMAKNILQELSETPTVVVAGKLHTGLKPIQLEENTSDINHPMGERIKDQVPDVISGRIEYVSGQYHNIGTQDFETREDQGLQRSRFYKSSDSTYIFEIPEAHLAIVPNPDETMESLSPTKVR